VAARAVSSRGASHPAACSPSTPSRFRHRPFRGVRRLIDLRPPAFRCLRGTARALELGARALTCVAAGVLNRRQLAEAIAGSWDDFFTAEEQILSGLMPWERAFYERFLKPDDEVVIIGSGTGRDLIALAQAGYRVRGIEPSVDAAAIAGGMLAKLGIEAGVETAGVEDAALDHLTDAYVFSWFCYSYIPGRTTRVAILRRLRAHLRPGGRVLISYLTADTAGRRLPVRLTNVAARLTGSDWRAEANDALRPAARGVYFEHAFVPGELEGEANSAGLTVIFNERRAEAIAVLANTS
jgi:SAM-dependent methyltransferase